MMALGLFDLLRPGRARADADRRAHEARLSALIEAAGDAVMIADTEGHIVYWNPAAEALLGFSAEEAMGQRVEMLVPEKMRGLRTEVLQRVTGGADGTIARLTTRVLTAEGASIPVDVTVSSWSEGDDRFVSAIVRDVRRRASAEAQSRRFHAAIEQANYAVAITDSSGVIEYVNPMFTGTTGYLADEAIGRTPSILQSGRTPAKVYEAMWAELHAGRPWRHVFINRRKDGALYPQNTSVFPILDDEGSPEAFVSIAFDVTQEEELRAKLRQAQKVQALGQLTGGIAHDFNNVLAAVLANAQLVQMSLDADSPLNDDLDEIVDAARRATELVRKLMVFAREEPLRFSVCDLRDVVEDTVSLLRRVLPANVELRIQPPAPGVDVLLDHTAVQQILLNLATNGRDAMPAGGVLEITVDTEGGTGEEAGTVMLSVRDNGTGIAPYDLEHIFDPFFTTKEEGRGTGLGLAMVRSLTDSLGGSIDVQSEQGRGTTFLLTLPVLPVSHDADASDGTLGPVIGGRETILFVDDDPAVRRAGQRVLKSLGYTVMIASDGDVAWRVLARHGKSVDLVVTDLAMPRMGGADLFRVSRAEEAQPRRFLFASGHSPGESTRDGLDGQPFIFKPWDVALLARAVRSALDLPVPDPASRTTLQDG